jgi:ubiquinone/menaquinone biosynthesis C-methylase UbiE
LILPNVGRLLHLKKQKSLLDLGCGQGVLARHIPPSIEYWGVDGSEKLLDSASKLTRREKCHFVHADATLPLPIEKKDFDCVCFILSLQNMENPEGAIQNAARHLKPGGLLLIVMNHPCFRIPRQSHWGIDESSKMQYRRINRYMSPEKIPIQTSPGKGEKSSTTYSYHFPLSSYTQWMHASGIAILTIDEWVSDKKSEGAKARMEDRARKEFPLFLVFLGEKQKSLLSK